MLVTHPLTQFHKALELLRKHSERKYHKEAVLRADDCMKVMTGEQQDIRSTLNETVATRIASNRRILASIMKTVEFCGRQNISLRGHRDSATDLEKDFTGTQNHGNFLALRNFRVDSGDSTLAQHLATAPRNATYTSSVTQNQVIDVLASQIQQTIIERVHTAKWFTVIADEVTDLSNKEQLSLVLRYVDSTLMTREDLIEFVECNSGITGRALADSIKSSLQNLGLDLSYLRGQAYDGAGNMAGSVREIGRAHV